MKKITLLFVAWLFAVAAHAQNPIYSTNFPAGAAPAGWTNQALGFEGETKFYFGDTYLPSSSPTPMYFSAPAAQVNDDISFDDNTIARLTSPAFDTSGYTSVSLSFEYGLSQTTDNLGILKVEVYNGTTWQQILAVTTTTAPVNTGTLDMTPYKNAAFQVRYTYNDQYSSNSFGCGVTNFVLQGDYDVVPNDLVSGAFPLGCGQVLPGTTVTATAETGLPVCNDVDGNTIGVWYKYYDPMNQEDITVSLCDSGTDLDTRLSVFKGTPDALTCLTANDDNCGTLSSVTFHYDGYTTYYILVSAAGNTTGNFTIGATCNPVPPENDEIINAIDVDQYDQPYTHHAVPLMYATTEADFANYALTGCDTGEQQNVFYKFTATANGTATVSLGTPNEGGFSLIMFYTAPSESAAIADLTWVNQSANPCNVFSDSRTITTVAGTTYYVTLMSPYTNSDVIVNITNDLGVGDNAIPGLRFYPNPVRDELYFDSVSPLKKVSVYNIVGQEIISAVPIDGHSIDLSTLTSGTYIIKAVSNKLTGTYKIVKQ
jgi:hypothetical protein